MRLRFLRELAELALGTALGVGLVWLVHRLWPGLFGITHLAYHQWQVLGGAAGFLAAVAWSTGRVERSIDHRLPLHQRPRPSFRNGRPLGVLGWRARDAWGEYLLLVLAVLVMAVILWLVRTYLPAVRLTPRSPLRPR